MAQVLKVGGRDLSPYVRVAHDDGLDPANPEFSEPQFSGSPALGDGQGFVADAVSNRLMSYPLILSADSTDELYGLVREINADLVKGAQVEYCSGGASKSTFFDLERGRLEPKFEFWIDQAARVRAILHLWTRPYGHTGTYRTTVASIAATGPQTLQATGILGDTLAQVRMRVDTTASYLATPTAAQMVAYGISQSPSYVGVWRAASITNITAAATVIGASGAVASQYKGVVASPRGEQSVGKLELSGAALIPYEGRQRLLMVARTRVALATGAPAISLVDHGGTSDEKLLASVVATHSTKWQVYDLGEWSVPAASGLNHGIDNLNIGWHSANPSTAASLIASPALQISALMAVPLDIAAGIHLADGWTGGTDPHLLFSDSRVIRKTASNTFQRDESANLRGVLPVLPPTGSPVASGPLSIIFATGDPTNFVGNKPVGVSLSVRERFTYLR